MFSRENILHLLIPARFTLFFDKSKGHIICLADLSIRCQLRFSLNKKVILAPIPEEDHFELYPGVARLLDTHLPLSFDPDYVWTGVG